jgi:hypothetical protein
MAKEKKSGFVEKSEKDIETMPKGKEVKLEPVVEQKEEGKQEEKVNPHTIGGLRTDKYK